MPKILNSSELAKQVSEKLNLSQTDSLALYNELSQIPNGQVKDALDALSDRTIRKSDQITKYVACIKGSCVHGAKYTSTPNADPLDNKVWTDADKMPLFLEIVEAATPTRAMQIAAAHAGVDVNVIELQPL